MQNTERVSQQQESTSSKNQPQRPEIQQGVSKSNPTNAFIHSQQRWDPGRRIGVLSGPGKRGDQVRVRFFPAGGVVPVLWQ